MNKLRLFFNTQLKDFDEASFIRILKIFALVAMGMIFYALIFSGFQIVDEFEHLHASWLVSIGKLPYRDFLEHHNPLLWYLSAPVVRLFYDDVIVFYVMRAVSYIASIFIGYYIYKITLFWGDKKSGWLAVAFYLGNIITFYTFYQFRPDNFMNLCFIAGVYYLFQALKTDKLSHLTLSFLCFTLSFLFLQKISLLLLVVEIILLGLVCLKKIKLKPLTIAAIPSLLLLFAFLGFFYVKGNLLEYIEMNYRFNQAMLYYYARGAFWYQNFFFSIYGIALLTAILFFKKTNMYFKIAAILFGAEFLMRGFYFSPHTHYYSLITILAAIVLSIYADKIMPSRKFISATLVIILFLNLGHVFNILEKNIPAHNSYNHYRLADWAHKNSNSDDMMMNGYDMIFNIYRPDVSYYWFQLDAIVPIMEHEYNLSSPIDVNQIIVQQRPKFVYAVDYIDALALRFYGERKFSQQFIPEILQTLYKPTPFANLWELK